MNEQIVFDVLLKMFEVDLDLLANDIKRLRDVKDFLFAGESFMFEAKCFYSESHEIQFNQYEDDFEIRCSLMNYEDEISEMLEALLKEEIENDKK